MYVRNPMNAHQVSKKMCIRDRTSDDMMKVRNLGKKSLDEVLLKLKEMGLHLRPNED